ncbi:iron-containing alcohol dehydrogenase [Spirosoma sp. KNUC1025]|uniref:iron-containing alcohol dehydrogenase n=1 Tax=Spirosoma sp. KNUC1025 TaxID=2894082 RepID=UPI00386EEF7C
MTQNLTIHFPGKLVFGKGSLANLSDEISALRPAKVLLVTIKPLLEKLKPLIDKLTTNGIGVWVDTSIVQEPSFSDFNTLMQTVVP